MLTYTKSMLHVTYTSFLTKYGGVNVGLVPAWRLFTPVDRACFWFVLHKSQRKKNRERIKTQGKTLISKDFFSVENLKLATSTIISASEENTNME